MYIIKFLLAAIVVAVLCAVITIVMWFVFGLMVCFYKIYLKKKPEVKIECTHDHVICDEGHPEYPFACTKCGERF